MAGDEVWQRALAQVFSTYATEGAGISEDKLVKHTVKAAGKMGLPGTKHARTKQFNDYMAGARERKEYYLQGDVVFRNPAAAAAPPAAPAASAAPPAASAPAPAQGSFAQMLQPAVGEAAAVQGPPAPAAGPSDTAAAPDAATAAAAKAKGGKGPAPQRQTLNDIATIATELTEHQGAPASGAPAAAPVGVPVVDTAQAAAAAAAAPQPLPAAVGDAVAMPVQAMAPAPTAPPPVVSMPADMPMPAAQPLPSAAADGGVGNGKKRGRPRQEGSWASDRQRTDVKRGKFSEKEKDTIRSAVKEYAAAHGHSQEDMTWLFKSRTTPGVYSAASGGAWQQIAKALPDRTTQQVWACGTRILHPNNYKGSWKQEEDDQLRQLVETKGNKWLEIGEVMGRMGEACRDRWRTIGLGSARKMGPWDDEEAAALTREVQRYMEAKQGAKAQRAAVAGQAEDKRVVLDDIDWGAVAKAIGTRNHAQCMERWYKCQAPSMVERGVWGQGDDRRMLHNMIGSHATQEWELDWNTLVEGRTAEQARRRWTLMLKHVPEVNDKEFTERLSFLVEKYVPELREAAAANAAAAAQAAAAAAASEPQPAADAAAAVAAIPMGAAMPAAPGDVQLTIPPVDPLAADNVVVPIPDA